MASLMGSAPQHKGAFQAPAPSARPWFNGKRSDSGEEMSQLPNFQAQAHLPSMPNCDEGADGLEGSRAAGQQVGSVMGL